MDLKILFLCLLAVPFYSFSMEQESPNAKEKSLYSTKKGQSKKPNKIAQTSKAVAALSASAFFIYALMNSERIHKNLLDTATQGQPHMVPSYIDQQTGNTMFINITPQVNNNPYKVSFALRHFVTICKTIINCLGFYRAGNIKRAEAIRTTYTALSAIGAFAFGKYGIEKLYNTFFDRSNESLKKTY